MSRYLLLHGSWHGAWVDAVARQLPENQQTTIVVHSRYGVVASLRRSSD